MAASLPKRPPHIPTLNGRRQMKGPLPDLAQGEVLAEIFQKDVIFRLRGTGVYKAVKDESVLYNPTRGAIRGFSDDSRRRLKFTLRNTIDLWDAKLCLTYPGEYSSDGKAIKRHLAAFLAYLRRRRVAYLWVLEFQKRGAPHFHFLIRGYLPLHECKARWYDIVGSNDPRHLQQGVQLDAIKHAKQASDYISKQVKALQLWVLEEYTAKGEQKQVPENYRSVGRFWGCSRLLEKAVMCARGAYREISRALKLPRAAFEAKCRSWGFKWRWSGYGFVFIDGAPFFRQLLRQALLNDAGAAPWDFWDGLPAPVVDAWEPLADRIKRRPAGFPTYATQLDLLGGTPCQEQN